MNGQIISHYRILEKLGAGGMGVVYKAEDLKLGRMVALKFLPEDSIRDPRALLRFKREARTASALDHPNICTIYEIDEDQGRPFIAMQLLEGQTLRERIAETPIQLATLLEWAVEITEALQAAHAKGIVHRDMKPANVFITQNGQAKILDFGLAKLTPTDISTSAETMSVRGNVTHTGAAVGTVAYMSPEQARGETLDARTDIFSFGVLLYEMATGKQAFSGTTWAVTVHAILGQAPVSLNESMPGLPQRLQEIIDKCLIKNRDLRYQTAADVHRDLVRLKKDYEAGKSLRTVRVASRWTTRRKRRLTLAVGAVVLVAAAVITGPRVFRRISATSTPAPALARHSLAVLPLSAPGADAKLTAFGNGLLDDVAAKLSQLGANHEIEVVPARTLVQDQVSTLDAASKAYGVNVGLAVSISQNGDLVRAAYSLTDAKSGKNLAGDTITAPTSDLFTIEDKLATSIASALQIPLRTEEQAALNEHATNIPEAFQYYVQGIGYLRSGRRDPESLTSAETLLQAALKLDPNFGRAEAALGEVYWQRYDLTKQDRWVAPARKACNQAIELANAGADGHLCLGLMENTTGEYARATEQFQQAVQLEPANLQAYLSLAEAYQHLNQPDKAEETYKRMISLHPKEVAGYSYLGVFYFSQAQYDRAQAMLERAIALAPDTYGNYSNLGATLLYEGKYDEAARAFAKSIAIRPTADAYANSAAALFYLRRFEEAANQNLAALKLNDHDYQTWANLGDSYYYGGNQTASTDAFKKAISLAQQQLKLNRRDSTVLANLAYYFSMINERSLALSYLDRSLQAGRGDKDLLFNAAQVYNQLRETGTALEFLGKALAAGYSRSVVTATANFDNLHDNPRYKSLVQ